MFVIIIDSIDRYKAFIGMPEKTIRSVQYHQKVGCLFRKRIWSILRKVHSIDNEKEMSSRMKWVVECCLFSNFSYSVLGGSKRFSSLFGNHFSRFDACLSVYNRKTVSVFEAVTMPESHLGICEDRLTDECRDQGDSLGSHLYLTASSPPTPCHLGQPYHSPVADENQKRGNYLPACGHRER